jgi:hypothetical protein
MILATPQAHPITFPKWDLKGQREPLIDFGRNPNVCKVQIPWRPLQSGLGQSQRQGPLGMHRRARRFTRGRVEPEGTSRDRIREACSLHRSMSSDVRRRGLPRSP